MLITRLFSRNSEFQGAQNGSEKIAAGIAIAIFLAVETALPAIAENQARTVEAKASVTKKLAAVGVNSRVNIGLKRFPDYYYLTTPGMQAFPTWQRLHARAAETGYYPLIWLDKARAEIDSAHMKRVSAPIALALKELGVKPRSSVDLKEVNARLASRPKFPAYPFPTGKVTNQEEAIRADILLQLQDLHMHELKRNGVTPGAMPTSMQEITKYGDINRKYLTVMMLVMSKPQSKGRNLTHQNKDSAGSIPSIPAEQIAKTCQRGEEKDFPQWLTMTEHSDPYYKVETGTANEVSTPQQESRAAFQYDFMKHKYFPLPNAIILLIPAKKSYLAPAYLDFGDVNACPKPAVHVAAAKWWQRKYGAELVSITDDSLEFYVKNPPRTDQEALKLAREQFIYCPDTVKQGAGNLSQLAADIYNAKFWTFWWD